MKKALLGALVLSIMQAVTLQADDAPKKVLFIGNSLIYCGRGLGVTLESMGRSSEPLIALHTEIALVPGMGLEATWNNASFVHDRILHGGADVVVLQPTLHPTRGLMDREESFNETIERYADEIRSVGARPILIMNWTFKAEGSYSIEQIEAIMASVQKSLGIDIAPVGLAWANADKEYQLSFDQGDGWHESEIGCYLTACVLYATIFGRNPMEVPRSPDDRVSEEQARYLKKIAWQTVLAYKQRADVAP
jgi:hypothetical protein